MPRATEYLNTFMAELAAPAMYAQIIGDIDDLQRQREYIDSLIAQEQNNRNVAEQQFAVPPQDLGTLKILLSDFQANKAAASRLGQGIEEVERQRGGGLPSGVSASLQEALGKTESTAIDWMRNNVGSLTPAQRESVISQVESSSDLDPAKRERIKNAAKEVTPRGVIGTEGLTAEQQRLLKEREGLEAGIAAIGEAGPSGIRGGQTGRDEITRRGTEGDTLLEEYFTALDDGQATVEDFGGDTERFAEASRVYGRAKAAKAYRNDQRKFFEQSFLDASARINTLEQRAEELARPAGMTRQDEIAKRYWTARGYNFDQPYLGQQKKWYYENLIRGDEMFNAGLEASQTLFEQDPDRYATPQGMVVMLTPDNEAQRLARDYVSQRFASGERTLSMGDARTQLGKVLKGEDLSEALSFAHAFNRGLNQNIQSPSDAAREIEQQKQAVAEKERAREVARNAQRAAEQAADLKARMEAEGQGVTIEARKQVAMAPEATSRLYNRLRLKGLARDEIGNVLNQGFEILVTTNVTEETRGRLLEELGFGSADQASLAVAFGPQIRQRIREADPTEVLAYSEVPVLAQYLDDDTIRRATQSLQTGGEFEGQEITAPGVLPPIVPAEAPDFLEQPTRERPGIPGFQSKGPFLTAAQRAVFEEMDDDTLKSFADRSTYAAQELALRQQAAPVDEETTTDSVVEEEETLPVAPPPAPAPRPAPRRAPAPAPAPAPRPSAPLPASVVGGAGLPGSRAAAPAPVADPFARLPGENDADYFARLEGLLQ